MENSAHKELVESLEAYGSQLKNVLSNSIGTGDYSMPTVEEVDDTII